MSQRQKQRTNENRARRLGTGEGISRSGRRPDGGGGGGVPMWAWVVGGAVLIAAIAIVAAIVVTRGNSSSGSSGTQTSSVITARNSTAKVDWVSAGTWPPNYTNLQGALSAMGLPSANGTTGYATHFHAHITLYVFDGHSRTVPIPSQIGIDAATQTLAPIHTHDDTGVIHFEADEKSFSPPLQDVFNVWGLRLTSQCVGGYCGGVKMWVNGTPNPQLGTYKPKEHDAITIVEGTPPANFKPDASYKFPAGE
jgi:hypothetical protein